MEQHGNTDESSKKGQDFSISSRSEGTISINLPEPFIPVIHELSRLSKKSPDDLITSYIAAGLQSVCDMREMIIGMLFDSNGLFDRMRKGLNSYHGRTELDQDLERDGITNDSDHDSIHVVIKLPPRLRELIDQLCAILNRRREDVFAEFIAWRIKDMYEDEDKFIDSIDGLKDLLDGIAEELDSLANTRGNA